ncbi:WD40/YVTN/BNR-like repeat-containing protein [Winogradskyella immobilis]|uniref:Glycosyl hydrolase n=1 Tax=Winogradskyella immobilis TaxID=2816852 RepID=A0ABS8EPE2_9FLAO|nr:glycosyl hydrolase [Winogradskyella immobilis]MCC1485089.1 glycosyl hydrolase [Winogradskyella immobilis]MCG0017181.1 glycosyl hydrolase [Winogradskyella immobilis]
MKSIFKMTFLWLCILGMTLTSYAQNVDAGTFSGLKLRNIGPAFTSGRIADIAIHPENENVWYVAVGSGGVWKTVNSGTTWKPIFDNQKSYSIGCITIDPNNTHTIWVGTGENVGGRHVAFGDGIYVSHDDGASWKNMGLKNSEHLSKIIVHPENSDIVWAVSQGPLWTSGGERGVYKTVDGGKTWNRTLGDAEWVGATDLLIDPRNPDVLYAATWQRQRTVAAYLGGGPGTGIHKSNDGGETWIELKKGIPGSNKGKIGLAMSPFNPDVIYAAIELDRKTGGVFMSSNRGESWTKQSDAVSGGTGPHYYQELYASPHHEGKLFLMNNRVLISDDHGKTFYTMNERNKHVDSHAMAFKSSDPNYVLFGTDGGLYESFDLTKSWKFIRNLPITQYFKLGVDDSEPFYKIYAGTQDNGSHGGPSRTTSSDGIASSDWWKTLGADGHQSAVEPGNPDITYGEFQQGALWRIDQTTKETVFIQPQAREGEPFERFNWDAPILVSPHNPKRLYFASQRVWRSENRGDDWTPISKDLTLNQDRITLPMFGKQQSWDNAWDIGAMSNYNTITSLAESPKQEGLVYAGTDDGQIQVTENGGQTWRKFNLATIKGLGDVPFVNDVRADLFDANVVYAAVDNHKYGDYKPYVIKSTDKGKSWKLINGDLPERLLVWRLVQDHINKDLMFAATEYGIYFTYNSGTNWVKLTGGVPTIAFRDITIQRRENDLVGASFGRGFFILDDISPLRNFDASMLKAEATLFDIKDALWYRPSTRVGSQGDAEYIAPNPAFGATFTYFMASSVKSLKGERKTREKTNTDFPGWDALETENNQDGPHILLIVKDASGNVVNTVRGTNRKGFNRVSWGLNHPNKNGERLNGRGDGIGGGFIMATPGTYSVTLVKRVDGVTSTLQGPKEFNVKPMYDGALPRKSYDEFNQFRKDAFSFQQDLTATNSMMANSIQRIAAMKRAANKTTAPNDALLKQINDVRLSLLAVQKELRGHPVKGEIGERSDPTPNDGNRMVFNGLSNTYGPTGNQKASFNRAKKQLQGVKAKLQDIVNTLPAIERSLKAAGAPWIEGQGLIKN